MDATSDPVVLLLDEIIREGSASIRVRETLERVQRQLAVTDGPMAWETVPLSVFARSLPSAVRSCWVFVLRAGARTGAERHPNSHQRSLSLAGAGTFEVREADRWSPHRLVSDPGAALDRRWVTIPPDTWHRPLVGERDWGMLSFHTVPSADLMEERPADPSDLEGATVRNPYAA